LLKDKITELGVKEWADTLKEGDKTTLQGVLKYLAPNVGANEFLENLCWVRTIRNTREIGCGEASQISWLKPIQT
jgi:hypothetical protein